MRKLPKKPINLKAIYLEYEDGTLLMVPDDKTMKVGTAFMSFMGTESIEWKVVANRKKPSLLERIKGFFSL